MPERLGFRLDWHERWHALRPIAVALVLFLMIGVVVLALYERQNRARHERSQEDRRLLHDQNEQSMVDRANLNRQVGQNNDRIDRMNRQILEELRRLRAAVEAKGSDVR